MEQDCPGVRISCVTLARAISLNSRSGDKSLSRIKNMPAKSA